MTTEIQIYPAESGKSTNQEKAQKLATETPLSFRVAQDVLVAARKLNKGGGFFTSEKSLQRNLQAQCYKLKDALRNDGYMEEELAGYLNPGQGHIVMSYFSEFSDAFPNWQAEYGVLNRYIPLYFA